jgi:hypothetical protein
MAEELLNGAKIGAGIQKVRSESMAQRVSGKPGVFVDRIQKSGDRILNRAQRYSLSAVGKKESGSVRLLQSLPNELVTLRFVIAKGERRVISNRNDALLSPFASHFDLLRQEIDVASIYTAQL